MESGVFLNPNRQQIEQARIKKKILKQQENEKKELLSRVETLEERIIHLEEVIVNLSSKNL